MTSDSKSRSMVVAPTVKIQGAAFTTVSLSGPLLPAEQMTGIPFSTAWKAPMAIGSVKKFGPLYDDAPRDNESTSTPSVIASSNAARIVEPRHPVDVHTLYIAILDVGDPPLAVPAARP